MLLQEILEEDNCGNFIDLFAHLSFLSDLSEVSPIILKNSYLSLLSVLSEPIFDSDSTSCSLEPPVKYTSLVFELILTLEVVLFLLSCVVVAHQGRECFSLKFEDPMLQIGVKSCLQVCLV